MTEELIFCVDFSWLYYRSRFAFSSLTFEVKGLKYATGTIHGIYEALFTIMESYGRNTKILLCLDGESVKQNAIDNSYKSGRDGLSGDQDVFDISRWDIAKHFLPLPNVTIVWHGKMEADDTMAYIAKTKKENEKIILFSGDGDLRQEISTKNNVFCANTYTRGDGYAFEDEKHLFEKGIKDLAGLKPESVALFLAIVGDSSDNINGIPRFRRAVAKDLANECLTLDRLKDLVSSERNNGKYDKNLDLIKENIQTVIRNWKMIKLDPLFIPSFYSLKDFTDIDIEWFNTYGCSKAYSDMRAII